MESLATNISSLLGQLATADNETDVHSPYWGMRRTPPFFPSHSFTNSNTQALATLFTDPSQLFIPQSSWIPLESTRLETLVRKQLSKQGSIEWSQVAAFMPDRSPGDCMKQYNLVNSANTSPLSDAEKVRLSELVDSEISWYLFRCNFLPIRKEIGDQMNRPAYHLFRIYKSTQEATRASTFTAAQDAILVSLMGLPSNKSNTGRINWTRIATSLAPFTATQCKLRFRRINGAKRGRWTAAEDLVLKAAVNELGETSWEALSKKVEGRSGMQCRERWLHSLKTGTKKGAWSEEEDSKLVEIVEEMKGMSGGKVVWEDVAEKLANGRSKNLCRSRFAVLLKRV
jgi:hypothetical protein